MVLWRRAALLGFLSWLVPFVVSLPMFLLKQANAPLFENAITLVVLLTAGVLLKVYFKTRAVSVREAALVGILWLLINLVFDYPMFAYGPMKMTAAQYYSEIGLGYLVIPVFAFAAARLTSSQTKKAAGA